MAFDFFSSYEAGGSLGRHIVEDWSDAGLPGTPIAGRTLTVDEIVAQRLAYSDWSSYGFPVYDSDGQAWVDDDGFGLPSWTSPAALEHKITGPENLVAFGIVLFPNNYHYSPTLPTQIDVQIATFESGFGGSDVAGFRAEMNQSTMGSVANARWGALLGDGSYDDAGDAGDIYYTLGVDIFGNWESRTFGVGAGHDFGGIQAGGAGSGLIKSPSNTYLVRTVLHHSGWTFNTNLGEVDAWTWSPPLAEPPIARLYPRDDGRGIDGNSRIHPPPKSRRIVGGHL